VSTPKSLLFERHDRWMILVHGTIPPVREEWAQYVDALHEVERSGGEGLLVLTDGVGPDATQRKMVSDVKMRTSVTTQSRVARGMVTALGWMGVAIRAFAPNEIDDALAYLGIPEPSRTPVTRRLVEMRLELAGQRPIGVQSMTYPQLLASLSSSLAQLGDA
jgi:hypothetical protein